MKSMRSVPIERALAAYCRERRLGFLIDGVVEPAIRVLAPEAFLPIVVLHAEMSAHEALKTGRVVGHEGEIRDGAFPLGSTLHDDDGAVFKVFARVEALSGDGMGSFRGVMFMHGLHKTFGWERNHHVECAGIYDRYNGDGLKRAMSSVYGAKEMQWPPTSPR